jgi:hypothetical protein
LFNLVDENDDDDDDDDACVGFEAAIAAAAINDAIDDISPNIFI